MLNKELVNGISSLGQPADTPAGEYTQSSLLALVTLWQKRRYSHPSQSYTDLLLEQMVIRSYLIIHRP